MREALKNAENLLATAPDQWRPTTFIALRQMMRQRRIVPSCVALQSITDSGFVNGLELRRNELALLGGGLAALELLTMQAPTSQETLLGRVAVAYRSMPPEAHEAFVRSHADLRALAAYVAYLSRGGDELMGLLDDEHRKRYQSQLTPVLAAFVVAGYEGLAKTAPLVHTRKESHLFRTIEALVEPTRAPVRRTLSSPTRQPPLRRLRPKPPSLTPTTAAEIMPGGRQRPMLTNAVAGPVPTAAAMDVPGSPTATRPPSIVPVRPPSQDAGTEAAMIAGTYNGFCLAGDMALWSLVLAGKPPVGEEHAPRTGRVMDATITTTASHFVALTQALSQRLAPSTGALPTAATGPSFEGNVNGMSVLVNMETLCELLAPRHDAQGRALAVTSFNLRGTPVEASSLMARCLLSLVPTTPGKLFVGRIAGRAVTGELSVVRMMLSHAITDAAMAGLQATLRINENVLTAPLTAWWLVLRTQQNPL